MNLAVLVVHLSTFEPPNMKKVKVTNEELRSFPWPEDTHDKAEILIESTSLEWYDAKHPEPSKAELDFINSIEIKECHRCGCKIFRKDGFTKSGLQIYYCPHCRKRFNPLTNTIFEGRKIPISEWIEYLLHLFVHHSIKSSANSNKNAEKTGKYWLVKVFSVLQGIQDNVVLDGKIYLDETYISKIARDVETKDGKKLRGISKNKLGIAVATNKHRTIYIATGTSKPSKKSTWNAYGSHIKEGSKIVHDEEKSHSILIDRLRLKSEVHSSEETKGLKDKDNPLNPVNRQHYLLKRFLREHGGFKREDLQDWLNLFYFIMNVGRTKMDKVRIFIKLAVLAPKRVKYRDVFPKKRLKLVS